MDGVDRYGLWVRRFLCYPEGGSVGVEAGGSRLRSGRHLRFFAGDMDHSEDVGGVRMDGRFPFFHLTLYNGSGG